MALLTPNATYTVNGVKVNEKIIPDGTRWQNTAKAQTAGFSANALYKKQQKLCGTGKPKSVTIHNTNDLANVNDDGEQYTRATYNENMGSARVHFYVDDLGAWQNLKAGTGLCANDPEGSAEVSWHSGDGSTSDGGNMTSLSIECIMKESTEHDKLAYDNTARLAAWLLWKHGLTTANLVTHTYWVNKSAGNKFTDVDEQCTNPVSGKKWCPSYIFDSNNRTTALKNWKAFKAVVEKYLTALKAGTATVTETPKLGTTYRVQVGAYSVKANAEAMLAKLKAAGFNGFIASEQTATQETTTAPVTPTPVSVTFKAGDKVKITGDKYYSGKSIPTWIKAKDWIVYQDQSGGRVVINKSVDGKNAIMSPVKASDLQKI